jgi:hypothetical protein
MVRRAVRSAFVVLALAGCASSRAGGDEERRLAGRIAGEPRGCVSATGGAGLTIVSRGAVGYRSGETLWVNRMGPACIGMRPTDILIVEADGSRYCRGDRVRAIAAGSRIPGPTCILGDFIPYRRAG